LEGSDNGCWETKVSGLAPNLPRADCRARAEAR
jgi:hypothetical protein